MREPPHDIDETLDMVVKLRNEIAPVIAMLPPTKAKQMIEGFFKSCEPMINDARVAFTEAIRVCKAQEQQANEMRAEAGRNLAKAKAMVAEMPAVDEVRKNLVPPAPKLPEGLSQMFAAELQQRYAPPPVIAPVSEQPGTAWQDWSLS